QPILLGLPVVAPNSPPSPPLLLSSSAPSPCTNCVLIGNKIFMRAMQNRNIPHASALATLMAISVLVPMGVAMYWKKRQDLRDKRRLETQTARLVATGTRGDCA
ncbi:MAG: hypothetical protein J6W80_01270, partial [Kiritimatiellae bacterium]|nr:hypothetical protein [Kiritimatiellia bacterium]